MSDFFQLKLANGSFLEVRSEAVLAVKRDDLCVFRRDFFEDVGRVVRRIEAPSKNIPAENLPCVIRLAGDNDLKLASSHGDMEREAMLITADWVAKLKLEMKLINAHYSMDAKHVMIQFSADGFVDFRELVKELARALPGRLELRQIGVRDEAGVYGGFGVCGQPLCCSRFLNNVFAPINIKMAKDQDLPLVQSSTNGACCRLKCCLRYEHEDYSRLAKSMPRKGEVFNTPQGTGKVVDRNVLTNRVSIAIEGGNNVWFDVSELEKAPDVKPAADNKETKPKPPAAKRQQPPEKHRNPAPPAKAKGAMPPMPPVPPDVKLKGTSKNSDGWIGK